MSSNVERTRAAWEAFSRRDFETQLQYIHPELEWRPAQGPGGYLDHEAALEAAGH